MRWLEHSLLAWCGAAVLACVGQPPPPPQEAWTGSTGSTGTSGTSSSDDAQLDTTSADGTDGTDDHQPPGDVPVVDHPVVTISDGPTFDFGAQLPGSTSEHEFTISNEGEGEATSLVVGSSGAPFVVVDHDCSGALPPMASCSARVSFEPGVFGVFGGELQLSFQDAGIPATASRGLAGLGVGMTNDLVINGGGEEGSTIDIPPVGWDGDANWAASDAAAPFAGARTLYAGAAPTFSSPTVIQQSIDVTSLTQWGDAGGVVFHFTAHHRTIAMGAEPTTVVLRFLESKGNELAANTSDPNGGATWMQASGEWVAPPDTHFVQVELHCASSASTTCDGYFDAVELRAEWQG